LRPLSGFVGTFVEKRRVPWFAVVHPFDCMGRIPAFPVAACFSQEYPADKKSRFNQGLLCL
jgi:hypothetical protein